MKYIVANWKMNGSKAFVHEYFNIFRNYSKNYENIIICPPAILVSEVLAASKNLNISIGLQNCYFEQKGAYTGEISAEMAADFNCKYVIIGHSERRNIFKENDELVFNKANTLKQVGIAPIVCVGESLQERSNIEQVLKNQLNKFKNFGPLIIAYEPIWAIGTGMTAEINDIEHAHSLIKKELPNASKVLYGGSVSSKNAHDILASSLVSGILVGGASLNANEFLDIANCYKL